jgi:DNA-binding response OmpR family regulator
MSTHRILVADDDALIVDVLQDQLAREGFAVEAAFDGEQALRKAKHWQPDLILLDVMMPKMQGWEVLRELRRDSTVPVLMLTARGEELDRVLGLELGADDYIVKPFSFRELLARVRAALRRVAYDRLDAAQSQQPDERLAVVGPIVIDRPRHRVTRRGAVVALSQREYELLVALLNAGGAVVRRGDLLDQVWGETWIGDPRTLDVHVRWLREKLEDDPGRPALIITVRGAGYRLVSPDELPGDA